jgi:LGFP repeat
LSNDLIVINPESTVERAYSKEYQNGIIVWSEKYCAHILDKEIADKWKSGPFPATSSTIRVPISDTFATKGRVGKVNFFDLAAPPLPRAAEHAIVWTPDTDVHVLGGPILRKWVEYGREEGLLRYPVSDLIILQGGSGYLQHFQGGHVFLNREAQKECCTGDFVIYGPIYDKWVETGGENGFLGYPTLDTRKTAGDLGLFGYFRAGSTFGPGDAAIYWSPSTQAHFIYGDILYKYESLGWESSCLRYPTNDQQRITNNPNIFAVATFQRGSITWYSTGAGAVSTCGDPCPPGEHREMSTGFCVQDSPPPPRCPDGSNLVNGRCSANDIMVLDKRPPHSGNLWYYGMFPAIGYPLNDGTLTKITNEGSNNAIIRIIKSQYGSDDCNNPSRVVELGPGESTENINSISPSPSLPIILAACIVSGSSTPDTLTLGVGYTYRPR